MPLPTKFIYAELSADSKQKLEQTLPYRYVNHFGTHVTIDWEDDFSKYSDLVGNSYKLVVDSLAFDERMEAIPVDLSQSPIRSVNKFPHISWSSVEGINPFYSNYLLFCTDPQVKFDPIEIEVVVKIDSL